MKLMIFTVIFYLFIAVQSATSDHNSPVTTSCLDSYQCALQSLEGTNPKCYGFQSCYQSRINSSDILECLGGQSCTQPRDLEAENTITCSGAESCMKSGRGMIKSRNGSVLCLSENSCSQSEIRAKDRSIICSGVQSCKSTDITCQSIMCYGFKSCNLAYHIEIFNQYFCDGDSSCLSTTATAQTLLARASMSASKGNLYIHGELAAYGVSSVYNSDISVSILNAFGWRSAEKVKIDSTTINDMTINLFGYEAGVNGQVLCREGHKCTVNCMGNGCDGFTFVCSGEATCVMTPAACHHIAESTHSVYHEFTACPIFVYFGSNNELESVLSTLDKLEIASPSLPFPDNLEGVSGCAQRESSRGRGGGGKVVAECLRADDTYDHYQCTTKGDQQRVFADNCRIEENYDNDEEVVTYRCISRHRGGGSDDDNKVNADRCRRFSGTGCYDEDEEGLFTDCQRIKNDEEEEEEVELSVNAVFKSPECDEVEECQERVFTAHDPDAICLGFMSCRQAEFNYDDDIQCYGYQSCMQATKIVTDGSREDSLGLGHGTGKGYVKCWSTESCYQAAQIKAPELITCFGLRSCAEVPSIESTDQSIRCESDRSCQYSGLKALKKVTCESFESCDGATIDSGIVACSGYDSCKGAVINANSKVQCIGPRSCYDAVISAKIYEAHGFFDSVDAVIQANTVKSNGYGGLAFSQLAPGASNKIRVYAYGHRAGYSAQLTCLEGQNCKLFCDNDGCKDMTFNCFLGSKCLVFPKGCPYSDDSETVLDDVAVNGTDCPKWMYQKTPRQQRAYVANTKHYQSDPLYQKIVNEIMPNTDEYDGDLFRSEQQFKLAMLTKLRMHENNVNYTVIICGLMVIISLVAVFAKFCLLNDTSQCQSVCSAADNTYNQIV